MSLHYGADVYMFYTYDKFSAISAIVFFAVFLSFSLEGGMPGKSVLAALTSLGMVEWHPWWRRRLLRCLFHSFHLPNTKVHIFIVNKNHFSHYLKSKIVIVFGYCTSNNASNMFGPK